MTHCKHLGSHDYPLCEGSPRSGPPSDQLGQGSWEGEGMGEEGRKQKVMVVVGERMRGGKEMMSKGEKEGA